MRGRLAYGVALLVLLPWAAMRAEENSPYREMETLARAMQMVRQEYVDEEATDYQSLTRSALRGMLEDLDPHSQFMDPEDFEGMQEDTRSQFGGLGVVVGLKDGVPTVVSPMEGTPGFRAGLLPGDRLLTIDGASAERLTLSEVVEKLRGKPGIKVRLSVSRPGESEPRHFEIEREIIKVPSVKGARILPPRRAGEPRLGYVRITQFSEPTAKELAAALDRLEAEGMEALVLDLRFNPGGLLGSAVDVSGEFLPPGQLVVSTRGRGAGNRREYLTPSVRKTQRSYPLAILVNGSSASGAEIVAGALKDLGRAVVIGETTFGKGSVQSVLSLPDGSALRLTTSKYYTPGRQLIHGHGIEPHLRATMTREEEAALLAARRTEDLPEADRETAADPVLERARDALQGQIRQARRAGDPGLPDAPPGGA